MTPGETIEAFQALAILSNFEREIHLARIFELARAAARAARAGNMLRVRRIGEASRVRGYVADACALEVCTALDVIEDLGADRAAVLS